MFDTGTYLGGGCPSHPQTPPPSYTLFYMAFYGRACFVLPMYPGFFLAHPWTRPCDIYKKTYVHPGFVITQKYNSGCVTSRGATSRGASTSMNWTPIGEHRPGEVRALTVHQPLPRQVQSLRVRQVPPREVQQHAGQLWSPLVRQGLEV